MSYDETAMIDAPGSRTAPPPAAGPDMAELFRRLPSPYMILDRDLRYYAVNDAYCHVLERRREDLIGRDIFEAFPNPGESGRRLRESFETVLATGKPHTIPLIPYPIERPASRGGGYEMRFWSAEHVALPGPDGTPQYLLQNTVDVTELQRLKTMAYGPGGAPEAAIPEPGVKDLFQRVESVQAENAALVSETERLRDLFMQAPSFIAVLTRGDFRFTLVNHAYQQLIGHRQVIGKTVAEAVPEVADQGFIEILDRVMRTGEPFIGQGVGIRLQRTEGAEPEERFLDFIYQPILAPDGAAWGVFVEGSDVTDRIRAEEQQKLLLDELNHRVKNTLATVQAIAAQTLRSSPEPLAFREAFESRLLALSATHDLLTETSWRGADLRDVLRVEFRPFSGDRYRLSGPSIQLAPQQALALGLIFHELATNAAKYGALSALDGIVDVTWRREAGHLIAVWTESGGPALLAPPERRGFGSRLIERSLKGQLRGEAVLDFARAGLVCRISLPVADAT